MSKGGTLRVGVNSCKNLIAGDLNGKSDPFVRLKVGNQISFTRVNKKTLNPEFNESFKFKVDDPSSEILKVKVFDQDKFGKDDELGYTVVPLSILKKGESFTNEYILCGVKTGVITLTLFAFDFGEKIEKTENELKNEGKEVYDKFLRNEHDNLVKKHVKLKDEKRDKKNWVKKKKKRYGVQKEGCSVIYSIEK